MADITYTANQDSPETIPGFEQYQDSDKNLVSSYQINSLFSTTKNFAELHIVDLADTLLQSHYNYTGYTLSANAQSAGKEGASVLTIDPIQDALAYGYSFGGVKLLYHFLNDLYTDDKSSLDFYIDSISADRTELRLLTNNLTADQVVSYTDSVKSRLQDQSDFSEFRLNFKDNYILIGINIDTVDSNSGKAVVIKLYEPLPSNFSSKSTLSIQEIISDSIAYELDYEIVETETVNPTLRSPNFNLDIQEQNIIPTQYFNYDELLSYKVNNANSEIYSMINEKGVELSIDYTDYSNFIHFSSAQERLLNFKYKIDLLTSYSSSIATASLATTGLQGASGSLLYYENLYQGVISNFDHYERFLYYESGSSSWPKSNKTKPYINIPSKDPVTHITNSVVTTWYNTALTNSVTYDSTNYDILTETIPTYLRDDENNQNYLTFIYMIGQHFDNLWLYSKAVTDKYDADNRIDKGISKDLVAEALKNFGVKLYTSNKSVEDLFTTFIGQAYQSGSEVINHYITGSLTGSNTPIQPTSYDNYQKEVQKRIYHNLPLLLKSKGTERGLRALINCLGIPSDILQIKLYGGRNIEERPFFGDYQHYTSSLDKIRLDHTGSIVTGNTLSNYTSIIKRDPKYTDDLHTIEVGFSPTDNIDNYIISHSSATFNIDDYLGDPRNLNLDNYSGLNTVASEILSNLSQYNVQDYVRLIKFFDNTVFKMVKDFIPARSTADTGIIIKPNLLNRSKAKSVIASGSRPEYTASIDTAFIEGGNATTLKVGAFETSTAYVEYVQTPDGPGYRDDHNQEQPRYNGEFSGSQITVSKTNLNLENPYKVISATPYNFNVNYVSSSTAICLLKVKPNILDPFYVTDSTLVSPNTLFTGYHSDTQYSATTNISPGTDYSIIELPTTFTNETRTQYDHFYVKAETLGTDEPCTTAASPVELVYGVCQLGISETGINTTNLVQNTEIRLWNWFTFDIHQDRIDYYITWNDGVVNQEVILREVFTTIPGQSPSGTVFYQFTQYATTVTVTAKDYGLGDTCISPSKEVFVGTTDIGIMPLTADQVKYGVEFRYSTHIVGLGEESVDGNAVVGGDQDNPNYQYLGTSDRANTDYKGIQSYFTPFPQIVSRNYRYKVYVMEKVESAAGNFFWNATTVLSQASSINLDWVDELDSTLGLTVLYDNPSNVRELTNPDFFSYLANVQDPPYNKPTYPDTVGDSPYPITVPVAYRNELIAQTRPRVPTTYTTPPKDPESLIRAFVVEVYDPTIVAPLQTLTVYGRHEDLTPVEGTGGYPHFKTPILIKADHDYRQSIPTYPGLGTWISFTERYFNNTVTP